MNCAHNSGATVHDHRHATIFLPQASKSYMLLITYI